MRFRPANLPPTIHFTTVTDVYDEDNQAGVFDGVDDPIITDSDAIGFFAG